MRMNLTHGKLFMGASYLAIAAIFFSHFLLSVSIVAMFILAVIRFNANKAAFSINTHFATSSQGILKWPYLAIALIFVLYVISGLNSSNIGEYLRHVQVKFPYLILPLAFLNHHTFSRKQYHSFYYVFIMISCIAMAGVLGNYIMDYDAIHTQISKGGAIPTPLNHTKFSVLVAIALNAAIILRVTASDMLSQLAMMSLNVAIIFLGIGLHILAVRSGLFCFYISFFIIALGYLIQQRRFLLIVGLVACSMLIPFIAYHTVPSFNKKVGYTVYDYTMLKKSGGQGYNDSERVRSFHVGMDLFKHHPWFGVGIGDVAEAVNQRYAEIYKEGKAREPHNQFLFAATAFGHVGLLGYVICYFLPFLYKKSWRDPLLLSFFIMLTCFCMIEKPLERSSFIVLHCLLVLYSIRSKSTA